MSRMARRRSDLRRRASSPVRRCNKCLLAVALETPRKGNSTKYAGSFRKETRKSRKEEIYAGGYDPEVHALVGSSHGICIHRRLQETGGHRAADACRASAPAAQPTVTLSASPSTINSGDSTTLSWTSTDATDADIEPGVGKVAVQGSTPVNPTSSTTFTITATGPGGTATATTRVTVSAGGSRSCSLDQSKHERTLRAERERRLLRFQ